MYSVVYAILISFIICVALILSVKDSEPFIELLALVDNQKNVQNSIIYNKELFHQIILTVKKKGYLDRYALQMLGLSNRNNIELYIDPYINYYVFNNKNTDKNYKKGIFVCLTPKKLSSNDCIWNMQNKTIAYNYISDYLFVQAIIKSYRQDITKIKLIKINDNELIKGSKTFDMFFTYVVIDSDYMKFIERSLYYINGLVDVDINRIKAFYPVVEAYYGNMREYFSNDLLKEYVNNSNALIPIMKYKIIPLSSLQERKETFITRFEKSETKSIAASCNKNEDCPYYKSNTNYPNSRGYCMKGTCEFPVGVKVNYIEYDDAGLNSPLCYECSDTTDLECCKKQKKPDYVFADDFINRQKYNMQTIIQILDIENY